MEIPQVIDHFELERELGRGGMGSVYLARDRRLGRQVAVKVVSLHGGETEEARKDQATFTERLIREARISAALDHPGIVTIYQIGVYASQPYIVMQFIDGPTLEMLLVAGQPFDRAETQRILAEIAAALDHAHEQGVIHRDIKPPNIMITRGRSVKICDFGIAKSTMLSQKVSSVLMGTPHYMAPEQLTYMPVDKRTDQWALGVVAYRMLTGMLPFHADDLTSLASQIVRGPLQPPNVVDPTLPPAVTGVMAKVLAKDPALRYETCSQFAAALSAALTISAPIAVPPRPVEPQPPPIRSNPAPVSPAIPPPPRERDEPCLVEIEATYKKEKFPTREITQTPDIEIAAQLRRVRRARS